LTIIAHPMAALMIAKGAPAHPSRTLWVRRLCFVIFPPHRLRHPTAHTRRVPTQSQGRAEGIANETLGQFALAHQALSLLAHDARVITRTIS
jgi:hypothetical protein